MRGDSQYKCKEFVAHHGIVNSVHLGPTSAQVIVSGGDDKKINLWRIDRTASLLSLDNGSSPVNIVRFNPAERAVLAGAHSGTLKLFSLGTLGKLKCRLNGHRSSCTAIDFHPFGDFVLSGSLDTNVKIWDLRNKSCIRTYKSHEDRVNCVEFSPDGKWFASGGDDGVVKLWDLAAGKLLNEFTTHRGPVTTIRFHPNELLFATASSDRTVKFWDLETFDHVGTTPIDTSTINVLEYLPSVSDSNRKDAILSVCNEGIKAWEWEPCRCTSQLETGWGRISSIALTEGVKDESCAIVLGHRKSSISIWTIPTTEFDPPVKKQFEQCPGVKVVSSTRNRAPGRKLVGESQKQPEGKQEQFNEEDITPRATVSKSNQDDEVSVMEASSLVERNKRHTVRSDSSPTRNEEKNDSTRHSTSSNSKHKSKYGIEKLPNKGGHPFSPNLEILDHKKNLPIGAGRSESKTSIHEQVVEDDESEESIEEVIDAVKPLSLDKCQALPVKKPPLQKKAHSLPNRPKTTSNHNMDQSRITHKQAGEEDDGHQHQLPGTVVVPASHDSPLGLSFSKFMPKRPKSQQSNEEHVALKNTVEHRITVANSLSKGHERFCTLLSARIFEFKHVRLLWQQGNIQGVLTSLVELDDVCITVDILKFADFSAAGLTLAQCSDLVVLINQALGAPYEVQIQAGFDTLDFVLRSFGSLISSNLQVRGSIGVNVAQEERSKHCSICCDKLVQTKNAIHTLLNSSKLDTSQGTLTPLMQRARSSQVEIENIINCR